MTIFVIIRISIIFILVFTIITITMMKRPDCMWKCLCRRYSWWLRQSWPLSEIEFWSPLHHCLKLFQIHIDSTLLWQSWPLCELTIDHHHHWYHQLYDLFNVTLPKSPNIINHHCLSKSITKSSESSESSLIIRRSGSTGWSCLSYHQHLVPLPE